MSQWTINGGACDLISCNLGVAQADRAVVELRPGMATAPTDESWVTLACDGEPVLYGRARSGASVSGTSDAVRVVIDGPWLVLEGLVYQQSYKVATADGGEPSGYLLTNVLLPEIQLGMDDDGDRRTTSQEVAAIVTYATGAGVPITLDSSFTGRQVEIMRMTGATCAAALLALLDHHPEVICYFTYGTGSAALTLKPLSGLSVITVSGGSAGDDRVLNAEFRPVLDYKPAGVRIVYTRTAANGLLETTTPDVSGSTGTHGKAPNVINWVVPLDGSEPPAVEEQEIKTHPLPDGSASQANLRNFWKRHLPWMEDGMADNITISNHVRSVDPPGVDEDETEEMPEEDYSEDPDDYPRYLVSGTVRPWMQVESAPMTVTAKFSWNGDPGTASADAIERLGKIFAGGATPFYDVQLTGTDANTRFYRSLASQEAPPDWPASGLAAAFMAAFTGAVWEGTCTVVGESQPLAILPGCKINVSGYDGDWASMAAVVQAVSFDSRAHSTTITCGPPRAMDFGDFYSLQRIFKKRQYLSETLAYQKRVEALPGRAGRSKGPTRTSKTNVVSDGSGGAVTFPSTGLQIVCRRDDDVWNVGITPGVVQTAAGSTVPTLEPATTPLTGAAAFWFTDEIDGTDPDDFRLLWLKCLIDDSDDYEGLISSAEVHLLATDPSPVFDPEVHQWVHIGSAYPDSVGGLIITPHIPGSLFTLRRGGPGCPFDFFTPD